MKVCDYGCGQEAKYQMTSGKWCCSSFYTKCSEIKRRNSETNKIKQLGKNNSFYGMHHSKKTKEILRQKQTGKNIHTEEWKKELSKKMNGENNPFFGKTHTLKVKKIISIVQQLTISKIKNRYPFFSKIEEMRYNPDKPIEEKEIQVHCKNHDCPNSKEKGGWFTPTRTQLHERTRQLESEYGSGGCYFYCSQNCRNQCPLYNLYSDPYKEETEKLYTQEEYNIWKQVVLERDNYECQYCESKENLHCHHINPVKTHPRLCLDPTNGIVFCKKCHYEIGHKTRTECSTGNLASKSC